ncbi:MAG TPA: flagellar hook-associated protein FlgL [Solirubrobacteraceae bacterium]|jgi:flagellar hook-associated protein 3 FlgL|nr:flagellar hook-associated protein FlgL [Solirubrobacteraceae bacterium]
MSTRVTTEMVMGSTLADINNAQLAMDRTQNELSSGKTILEPSDNPYGASQVITLQSSLDGLTSYEKSAQSGISWLNTASGALANINEVSQRVRELVVQAANGINNKSDLENIADEVQQITETVKQDAATQYAGQYIFSGTATGTAPYEQGEGKDAYKGNEGSIARAVAPGSSVNISVALASVLGNGQASGDGKLLDTLRTITQNLREGTPAAIEAVSGADLKALDTNLEALANVQANAGAVTDQLNTAVTRVQDLQTTTTQQLSNVQDANIAQVAVEFSSEQSAYDAALRAGASIVQESLLEFLH